MKRGFVVLLTIAILLLVIDVAISVVYYNYFKYWCNEMTKAVHEKKYNEILIIVKSIKECCIVHVLALIGIGTAIIAIVAIIAYRGSDLKVAIIPLILNIILLCTAAIFCVLIEMNIL